MGDKTDVNPQHKVCIETDSASAALCQQAHHEQRMATQENWPQDICTSSSKRKKTIAKKHNAKDNEKTNVTDTTAFIGKLLTAINKLSKTNSANIASNQSKNKQPDKKRTKYNNDYKLNHTKKKNPYHYGPDC